MLLELGYTRAHTHTRTVPCSIYSKTPRAVSPLRDLIAFFTSVFVVVVPPFQLVDIWTLPWKCDSYCVITHAFPVQQNTQLRWELRVKESVKWSQVVKPVLYSVEGTNCEPKHVLIILQASVFLSTQTSRLECVRVALLHAEPRVTAWTAASAFTPNRTGLIRQPGLRWCSASYWSVSWCVWAGRSLGEGKAKQRRALVLENRKGFTTVGFFFCQETLMERLQKESPVSGLKHVLYSCAFP